MIQSIETLAKQFQDGHISADEISYHYGVDTVERIIEMMQGMYYKSYYA